MSRGLSQPVGQKRLTNIAVVRMKKVGGRFEIACYRNKVGDWRDGIEKDLDEVLQTMTIFANVSKGIVAKKEELARAFGTTDDKAICLEILNKGELQVSDRERKSEFDNLFRDVASLLSEKCIDPSTNRPYTTTMLERALRDIHFNVDPKKSAKALMLEALPQLQQRFPIARAKMGLRLSGPMERLQELLEYLGTKGAAVQEEPSLDVTTFAVTAQVDPGMFRDLHSFMQGCMGARGRVDVLSLAMKDGKPADELSTGLPAPAAARAPDAPPQEQQAAANTRPGSSVDAPSSSSPPAPAAAAPATAAAAATTSRGRDEGGEVLYRGPIAGIPDDHASRRDRFAELDTLQAGWQVELKARGETVDAVFFAPGGERLGAYANARRAALQASKAQH